MPDLFLRVQELTCIKFKPEVVSDGKLKSALELSDFVSEEPKVSDHSNTVALAFCFLVSLIICR
jgi:hypothetical protein